MGGVHLPPRTRAADGEQQLLRDGESRAVSDGDHAPGWRLPGPVGCLGTLWVSPGSSWPCRPRPRPHAPSREPRTCFAHWRAPWMSFWSYQVAQGHPPSCCREIRIVQVLSWQLAFLVAANLSLFSFPLFS